MTGVDVENFLKYYASPGIMTDPGERDVLFKRLPSDIPALCQTVQGLILHLHWAELYGEKLSEKRKQEANLRMVSRQLVRIMELENGPLTTARPLKKRIIGTCRDYSVFMSAILQHQGVPARARCGFGMYFTPGHGEDHWTCEYWKPGEDRWVTVDAQLDQFQRDALDITFDTCDMPEGQFLPAGKAWQLCRAGKANPDSFGIFDMHGMWFIAGNLVRDLLSLNKIELLPWDSWTLMPEFKQQVFAPEYLKYLDRLAEMTLAGNGAFPEIRSIYENDKRLHPTSDWGP
jgi:hypothetical protein